MDGNTPLRGGSAAGTEAPETLRHTYKPHLSWVRENDLARGSLAWGAVTMITSEVHEIFGIHRAHGLAGLTAWLLQGTVDMWQAFSFIPVLITAACFVVSAHYGGLFLVHISSGGAGGGGDSVDVVHAALSAFTCCLAGYMGYNLCNYASRRSASRVWWAKFSALAYAVFMTLNVLSNLLVSRTSDEALFPAFFFSFVGSIIFLHRILPRFVFNSIQCLSWHFFKNSFPHLREARGVNLQHLLIACAINVGSFVVSCRFQPHVDRRIAARARRGRKSARSKASRPAERN